MASSIVASVAFLRIQDFSRRPASEQARLRAQLEAVVAVTTAEPSELLPDYPVVADFLPGYEASAWYGLAAPKGTPPEIVDRLNKAVNEILADPKAKARFTEIGAILLPGSAADFGKLVADETEKWGKVVKFAGAKVD